MVSLTPTRIERLLFRNLEEDLILLVDLGTTRLPCWSVCIGCDEWIRDIARPGILIVDAAFSALSTSTKHKNSIEGAENGRGLRTDITGRVAQCWYG